MTNKEFFIEQWNSEIKATVSCIGAVPDAKSNFKPDTKSRSSHELVAHLSGEIIDMVSMIDEGTINHDYAKLSTMEDAAKQYEVKSKEFLEKLAKTDDQTWQTKIIPFNMNGNKLFEAPMSSMGWSFFKELVHHRGQLSTYFRPMGVKNPVIYGTTAELEAEMEGL